MLKAVLQILLTPFPQFLKIPLYRLLGAKIGAGAKISSFSIVVADQIDMRADSFVRPFTIVGLLKNFSLGVGSGIGSFTMIHGSSEFKQGPRAYIGPFCVIDVTEAVSFGEYAALGPRSTIMTHGVHEPVTWGYGPRLGSVRIGNLVSVGSCCFIGPGVQVTDRVKIFPSSTVMRSISKEGLVCVSPFKKVHMPLDIIKKPVTHERMRSSIREALSAVREHFPRQKQTRIGIWEGSECDVEAFDWVFGYHLPEDIMSGGRGVMALDFLQIFYSENADATLLKVCTFFRKRFGLRWLSYRFRDQVKMTPPAVESLVEHRPIYENLRSQTELDA